MLPFILQEQPLIFSLLNPVVVECFSCIIDIRIKSLKTSCCFLSVSDMHLGKAPGIKLSLSKFILKPFDIILKVFIGR